MTPLLGRECGNAVPHNATAVTVFLSVFDVTVWRKETTKAVSMQHLCMQEPAKTNSLVNACNAPVAESSGV